MQVELRDIGRKFNQGWIFRHVTDTFISNEHVVIKGANGSGKSTLLQILFGSLSHSEGEIGYSLNDQELDQNEMVHKVTMCAPYLQLIEEFTLKESIDFQSRVLSYKNNLSGQEVAELLGLKDHSEKQLKSFSSGMKQRVKLGLAVLADVPLVLLDEPTMNLDQNAISWYNDLVEKYCEDRLFVVCSNSIGAEFGFCSKELDVVNFK